jgi:hypothetical protein
MSHNADPTLETDRMDQVLDRPAPSQPVVVIQYRTRMLPLVFVAALVFIVPISGILIYHRLVVDRLRAEADETARRALEIVQERTGGESQKAVPTATEPAGPLTQNSLPASMAQAAPPLSPAAAGPAAPLPAEAPPNAADPPASAGGVSGGPLMTSEKPPLPSSWQPDPAPSWAIAGSLVALTSDRPSAHLKSDLPVVALAARPPAPVPIPGGIPRDPAIAPATTAQGDQTPGDLLQPDPGPNQPVVTKDEQPLPSKEETERQIREEAAANEAERRARVELEEAELQRQRYAERLKFRKELRQVLEHPGNRAADTIDKLCSKYAYDVDPENFARAKRAWTASSRTQASKVRLVRSLDLPETVILNFLSDDLHARLRSRTGPQNRDEVRLRAAQVLLRYELPQPPSGPAPRPPKPADAGGRPATTQRVVPARAGDAASRSR